MNINILKRYMDQQANEAHKGFDELTPLATGSAGKPVGYSSANEAAAKPVSNEATEGAAVKPNKSMEWPKLKRKKLVAKTPPSRTRTFSIMETCLLTFNVRRCRSAYVTVL